ncbi:MAG: TonB-dependent receptor [Rikenellaceae bacterium]
MRLGRILLFLMASVISLSHSTLFAVERGGDRGRMAEVKGIVTSGEDGAAIAYATVHVDGTNVGTSTDEKGRYHLRLPQGEYTLVATYVGYESYSQKVDMPQRGEIVVHMSLTPSTTDIDAVEVKSESQMQRINKSAYNVQSLSLEGFKNSAATMTDVLAKMGGVKIREAGGVGSDTNISINGYSGNHVKIFIDGVQLDQNNSSFSLSNMPTNFAERIDVYSGVVPIEFGTDAIGGVINIVTDKSQRFRAFNLDASYSYGSFNTHSTYLNFGQTFESGFMYNINAYQNYSDNDYWIDAMMCDLNSVGGIASMTVSGETKRVRRFNDAYHNETVIGTMGVVNKSWADLLTLKFNYSQYFNEIQNGTIQDHRAYGQKERNGYSITPTLEYSKNNLFTEGLDVRFSANYSSGYTRNYDPGGVTYNWLGESVTNNQISMTDTEMQNNSYNVNFVTKYHFMDRHEFAFASTLSSASRETRSIIESTLKYDVWSDPLVNLKNIAGLSYRFNINEKFDASLFAKNYWQLNEGNIYDSDTAEYEWMTSTSSLWGYGAAATYFPFESVQIKASYEKAYRLPTTTEIFGDNDLENGEFTLKPESSDNLNLNLKYTLEVGKHTLTADANLIYRYTKDYIYRSTTSTYNIYVSSASYENFGQVKTKGYTASLRYNYDDFFDVGGTFNQLNARNNEKNVVSAGTSFTSVTYGVRLPNTPYQYANLDGELNVSKMLDSGSQFFAKHNFAITYDLFYQHEFPLHWENLGDPATKAKVPSQISHSLMLNYSFQKGKYNVSFEARNLTDANLYDNYSLQKPGRAFYAKLRVNINKAKKVTE